MYSLEKSVGLAKINSRTQLLKSLKSFYYTSARKDDVHLKTQVIHY